MIFISLLLITNSYNTIEWKLAASYCLRKQTLWLMIGLQQMIIEWLPTSIISASAFILRASATVTNVKYTDLLLFIRMRCAVMTAWNRNLHCLEEVRGNTLWTLFTDAGIIGIVIPISVVLHQHQFLYHFLCLTLAIWLTLNRLSKQFIQPIGITAIVTF